MFDSVALVIGEDRYTLVVKEKNLTEKMEPFAAALNGAWIEGIERTIYLPEDDVHAWKNAVDFMMTGEFEPRLTPSCDCPMVWKDYEKVKSHDAAKKRSMFDPPIQVRNRFRDLHDFGCGDERMGQWEFPEATAVAFNAVVDTFWLAEKYMWLELQEACVKRLQAFPIGPEAFMAIAAIPEFRDKEWYLQDGPKYQLSDLVREAYRYHITAYDESKVDYNRYYPPYANGRPKQYKCLNNFMRQNMTEEAWLIFKRLNTSRAESVSSIRSSMDAGYWSCNDERQGVCILDWNEFKAVDTTGPHKDVVDYTAASDPWASMDPKNRLPDTLDIHKEAIAQAAHQESLDLRWYGKKIPQLKKTYTFAEAKPGDVLTNIESTKYPKPGYFAKVLRTGETGWFPRQAVRCLEPRSKKYCTWGSCCGR